DLSWSESGEEAVRKFKKGDEVEAEVLATDGERERISLGVKQMEGDPYTNFIATHEKNSLVTGTVKSVEARGAVIQLTEEAEGDQVEAVIINVDRKTRSINLSIRAKDQAETSDAMNKLSADAASGTTNLGALLKAKLNEQKQ